MPRDHRANPAASDQSSQQITAVITRNGNAYAEGFVPSFWEPPWAYAPTEQPIRDGPTPEALRRQYTRGRS